MDCLFCKIINKEIPAKVIYEDDKYLAFLDIDPVSLGHTLVIPKKHADNFTVLSDQEAADLSAVIHKLAPKIIKILKADAYNLGLNNGLVSGQIIEHVHWHIIPRYQDDGLPKGLRERIKADHKNVVQVAKNRIDEVFSKLENKL
ncbi:HIT family protein [bacterium]|jgi:histidine triad (HIT) family protein|nr:HIT family protein [bacterium]